MEINMNALERIIAATLRKAKMKPICMNPPHSPSSGRSRQGPVFRNLATPKDAVNIEEKSVSTNNPLLLPTMIFSSKMAKVNNM